MNSGDKILDRIKADCDENISIIMAKAEADRKEAMADGQKKADSAAAEIAAKAKVKAAQIEASGKSRAELEIRNSLLKKRREEIDITVGSILDYLQNLDDKTYFDIIYRLAKNLELKKGTVLLNKKDLSRLPSDFVQKMQSAGIEADVSDTPYNIDGGFILKCGNIEENMDFAAVICEKRDKIEDFVNHELFAE